MWVAIRSKNQRSWEITIAEPGNSIATALRRYSIKTYDFGNLNALSTVSDMNDIKALRSAQKAGYGIEKQALKPPGHYLVKHLTLGR